MLKRDSKVCSHASLQCSEEKKLDSNTAHATQHSSLRAQAEVFDLFIILRLLSKRVGESEKPSFTITHYWDQNIEQQPIYNFCTTKWLMHSRFCDIRRLPINQSLTQSLPSITRQLLHVHHHFLCKPGDNNTGTGGITGLWKNNQR